VRNPEAGLDVKDFTTAIPREFDYLSKLTLEVDVSQVKKQYVAPIQDLPSEL
jgi:hypothetical protein